MTRDSFRRLTEKGPILLDGATGSNLMAAGMPRGICPELWILDHPQVLQALQRAYAEAGSQILYAPTFTAGETYLTQQGIVHRLEELNSQLVALSREASQGALVAGDLTTIGRADFSYDQLLSIYTRQASALRDSGVDLFAVETMMGLEETMAALEACRTVSDLPVLCTFSVTADGMLYFGGSVYEAAPQLEEFGADAVGINCSCGPDQLEAVIRSLAQTVSIPIVAKPNAGMPIIDSQGRAVYSMGPEAFAQHMDVLCKAGASLLGGCCGTTPAHLSALAQALGSTCC